jgi:hypothetical protein
VKLSRVDALLTDQVTLQVSAPIAAHLRRLWYQAGLLLFQYHKDMMCRYADAAVRGGGQAWPALAEWMRLHGVTEDDYPLESAYKCWYRWNREIKGKNPVFFGRLRSKPGVKLSEKVSTKRELRWSISDTQVELAAARLFSLAQACLPRVPKKFQLQTTCYLYIEMQGLSCREVAAKLGISHSKAAYSNNAIRNWASSDPLLAEMLRQSAAYDKK